VGNTLPLKAGRATLLDVSSDFSSAGPLVADAAFYIFEPGPKEGNSIVLFAAKTGSTETGVPDGVSIYAWETETLLSYYIEGRGQLITQIEGARQQAKDRDETQGDTATRRRLTSSKKGSLGGSTRRTEVRRGRRSESSVTWCDGKIRHPLYLSECETKSAIRFIFLSGSLQPAAKAASWTRG